MSRCFAIVTYDSCIKPGHFIEPRHLLFAQALDENRTSIKPFNVARSCVRFYTFWNLREVPGSRRDAVTSPTAPIPFLSPDGSSSALPSFASACNMLPPLTLFRPCRLGDHSSGRPPRKSAATRGGPSGGARSGSARLSCLLTTLRLRLPAPAATSTALARVTAPTARRPQLGPISPGSTGTHGGGGPAEDA